MQVRCINVVGVFRGAVSGAAQISDHIAGGDRTSHLEISLFISAFSAICQVLGYHQ